MRHSFQSGKGKHPGSITGRDRFGWIVLWMAFPLFGCSNSPPEISTTSDPAKLIEYGAELPAEVGHWTIDATSPVRIAGRDNGVDIQDILQIAQAPGGGYWAMVTGGTFHRLDSAGHFVKAVGRAGDGPGEFRSIQWWTVSAADSMTAYDRIHRRISIFDAAGKLARELRLDEKMIDPTFHGQLADGSWVVSSTTHHFEPTENGLARDSVLVVLMNSSGSIRDTLGVFPGDETFGGAGMRGLAIFPKRLWIGVGDSIIALGTGERHEIAVFDARGELQRTIRWNRPPSMPSRAVKDHLGQELKWPKLDPQQRAILEWAVGNPLPAHSTIRVDRAGNIWVQDYRSDRIVEMDSTLAASWIIYDAQGKMKAVLDVGAVPGIEVMAVDPNWVIGRSVDSTGVSSVYRYRIAAKPGKP